MNNNTNNIRNNSIGVMDSGVGGLTVLKEMINVCKTENYIYFGDTKNLPYGEKTKDELIKIVKEIYDFFQAQNVKAVVMACNTSSATAYDALKNDYDFKIYPLIQSVSKCVSQDKSLKRIAIMATQATVNSKKYTQELKKGNPNIEVYEQACPLFVPIVEQTLTDYDEKKIMTEYLSGINTFHPDRIILGCTHYPYLLDTLSKYTKKELFINPAKLFAQYVKKDLENNNLNSTQGTAAVKYLASSNPQDFQEKAKLFLKIEKTPELVCL